MKRLLGLFAIACSSSSHTGLLASDGGAGAGGSAGAAWNAGAGGGGSGGSEPWEAGPDAAGGPDVATDAPPDVATGGGGGSGGAGGAAGASFDATPGDAQMDAPGSCTILAAASKSLPTTFPWDSFSWIEATSMSIYCPTGCGTCQVSWGTPTLSAGKLLVPFSASCNASGTFVNCAGGGSCAKWACGLTASGDGVATLPVSGGGPWTVHDATAGAAWTGSTCRGGSSGYAAAAAVQAALEASLDGVVLDCAD